MNSFETLRRQQRADRLILMEQIDADAITFVTGKKPHLTEDEARQTALYRLAFEALSRYDLACAFIDH